MTEFQAEDCVPREWQYTEEHRVWLRCAARVTFAGSPRNTTELPGGDLRLMKVGSTKFAADSPLEGDGFELSLKIRPKENCGFRGLAINAIVPQTQAK